MNINRSCQSGSDVHKKKMKRFTHLNTFKLSELPACGVMVSAAAVFTTITPTSMMCNYKLITLVYFPINGQSVNEAPCPLKLFCWGYTLLVAVGFPGENESGLLSGFH